MIFRYRLFSTLCPALCCGLAIGISDFAPAACAQNAVPLPATPVGKPRIPAIASKAVANFCRRHQAAKTLAFTATYYSYLGPELRFINLNTYTVQARRPNLFAVRGGPNLLRETSTANGRQMTFFGDPMSICISDGNTLLEMDARAHFYRKSPAPARFEACDIPAFQAIGSSAALNANILDGYDPDPNEEIYQRPVLVFTRRISQDAQNGEKEVEKLYFAVDTGELIRYSVFGQDKAVIEEEERVEYTNWRLNARLADNTFTMTLPADARLMSEFKSK